MKHVNYMILPEHRLILECCKGGATVKDTIAMKKVQIADSFYNPRYNYIVDFRKFESFINSAKLKTIHDLVEFLKGLGMSNKVALLTTKPHQVVVSKHLKELSSNVLSIQFEVFSTLESALKYIYFGSDNSQILEYHTIIENKLIELHSKTE